MSSFESFFQTLESFGVTDVLLPFLLVFTIMFAILQKTKILGTEKKNFNVVIALVVALAVIIPHVTGNYPNNFDVVNIINAILPQIALIAVLLIMILILIGVFAPAYSGVIAAVGAILVLLLFLGTTNWIYGLDWLYDFFGEEFVSVGLIVLVFGIIIWFITSEPKSQAGKAGDWLKELFTK